MLRWKMGITGAIMLGLAGCGNTPGQRAVSGGMLGAGAGAGIAAIAGGPVPGAALVGAAGGAITGAVTTPAQARSRPRRRIYGP